MKTVHLFIVCLLTLKRKCQISTQTTEVLVKYTTIFLLEARHRVFIYFFILFIFFIIKTGQTTVGNANMYTQNEGDKKGEGKQQFCANNTISQLDLFICEVFTFFFTNFMLFSHDNKYLLSLTQS